MEIPFYKQEYTYTCGAAAMRMVLERSGVKKSEKRIVRILKTNKVRGTWHKDFPRVAEKYKLNYIVKRNSSIEDLKKYKKQGYNIVICYYYPPEKVDHYSVLKKIDKENIYFYDPYFGEDHKYSLNYFLKIWKSNPRYDGEKRWFFGVKKVD